MDTKSTADPFEALTRREAIVEAAGLGSTLIGALALGSIPLALAATSRRATAQAPTSVGTALEFAYLLENLESEFYKAVLGESATAAQNTSFATVRTAISTSAETLGTLRQIAKHEAAHVAFLTTAITALGGAPVPYTGAEFDFTGGNGSGTGPFAAAKSDPVVLFTLAQVLEDTGVRAYKGQLDKLIDDKPTLTAVLRIHSVEGRHAARIRRLRNVTDLKPWITSSATATTTGIPSAGSTGTVSLSATATGYGRTAGSFVTDGFAVGQQVTASGFTNPANNGSSVVSAVTATALTVTKTPATAAEAAAAGRSIATNTGINAAGIAVVTRAYSGEQNSVQAGVTMAGLGANTGGVGGVNEAFDEPLSYDDVIFVIKDFVIGSAP
jgi:ferritin-like protein